MSQRQPVHRRPSWAQNDQSYKIYMRKDLAADRSPRSDFGLENFSYDPDQVSKWQLPEDLTKRIPAKLQECVQEWSYAGAAVCTALERIEKLDAQSIHRAYPDKTKSPDLSRRGSSQVSTVLGANTPPMGSPMSPAPIMPSSLLPLDKISFEGLPQRHIIGMESPPFTPLGSQTSSTPEVPNLDKGMSSAAMPDAQQLSRQLSPISMMSQDSTSLVTPMFDENAWETYLNIYKAELLDIRQHALPRFRGCGYTIDRTRVELGQAREHHDSLESFNSWWAAMKPKVHKYEDKVRELQEPTLERVRSERLALGLCV